MNLSVTVDWKSRKRILVNTAPLREPNCIALRYDTHNSRLWPYERYIASRHWTIFSFDKFCWQTFVWRLVERRKTAVAGASVVAWRRKLAAIITAAMMLLAVLLTFVSTRTTTRAGRVVAGFNCTTLAPLGQSVTDAKMIRCSYQVKPVHYSPKQQVRGTNHFSLRSTFFPLSLCSSRPIVYFVAEGIETFR